MVKLRALAMASAASVALATAPALAEETALWSRVNEYWQVRVDQSEGNGCYAYALYAPQNVGLRIGFNRVDGGAEIILMSSAWTTIRQNQAYTVLASFDGGAQSTWTGYGNYMLGGTPTPSVRIPFQNIQIMDALAKSASVRFWVNGTLILGANLPGSMQVLTEMIHCQNQIEGSRDGSASSNVSPF